VKLFLRFLGFLFAGGTVLFIAGVAGSAGLLWHYSKDLPDYSQLQDYEPPVMTRVHAADGSLLAEYAKERRLYLPIQAIPKLVTNAFVAAEDKNFYQHPGVDIQGILRAGMLYVENYGHGGHPQGASTITQQVAKNFLLTNEVSFDRKIKEALLALRIERTYSKQKILELYLNEIYLGFGAYGVAAASLLYFDKSVHELTIAQAAYLAALPKGPQYYSPVRYPERALRRRNLVIGTTAAAAIIVVALLVLASVVKGIFGNLGGGLNNDKLGLNTPTSSTSSGEVSSAPAGSVVKPTKVTVFSPDGDADNPVPLVEEPPEKTSSSDSWAASQPVFPVKLSCT